MQNKTHNFGEHLNIAHIEPLSYIYGPGERFVVWVQGCSLGCKGCWNQEMWSFHKHNLIHREQMFDKIVTSQGITGVTLLGGEPLQQYENVLWLIQKIRKETDLSIMLYTGYNQAELQQYIWYPQLLEYCDLLIVGRYIEGQRNTSQQWRGSTNQEVIYPEMSRLVQRPQAIQEVEVIIDAFGKVTVLGYPDVMDRFQD